MILLACSLSGCPRALFAKKKAKFPSDDYLSTKFRASDGELQKVLLRGSALRPRPSAPPSFHLCLQFWITTRTSSS